MLLGIKAFTLVNFQFHRDDLEAYRASWHLTVSKFYQGSRLLTCHIGDSAFGAVPDLYSRLTLHIPQFRYNGRYSPQVHEKMQL